MDISLLFGSFIRRWYVAAPILLLGLVAALRVDAPPTYTVDGELLLITPQRVDSGSSNPALATSADVNTAAVLARVSVEGEELRDEIWEAGYSDLYDFFVPGNNPVAFFEATDTTPERATASGYAVARVFIEEMIRQQLLFGADVDALGSAELVRLSPPLSDGSDALVQRVAFLGVAGVLAVLAAIAFDGLRENGWRVRPDSDLMDE